MGRFANRSFTGVGIGDAVLILCVMGIPLLAVLPEPVVYRVRVCRKLPFDQMKEIEKAIQLFELERGDWPESLSELTEPCDPESPEPYISEIPLDSWKEPFVYRRSENGFELLSKGPDRIEGTEDDVRLDDP